ncbi:MAG: RNA polymerase sigma-70 factor [Bacteroidota bacterium]|nr:RNA polymerase sigma-70 factor [Bacteroidota bacterium]
MYKKDSELFKQIKRSNQDAFSSLFNKYYKELCMYSQIISNNKSCAEEVVADVFANIWIKRKKIKINKNVKAYLFRSTKNTTISYIRKRNKNLITINDEQYKISANDSLPDKYILQKESEFKLKTLISQIPDRSREIFIMHRFSDLKYTEIAEILDISVKTVEKHITKSLKLLRAGYKKIKNFCFLW